MKDIMPMTIPNLQYVSDMMDSYDFDLEGRWVEVTDHYGMPRWINLAYMTEDTPQ